MHFQLPSAWLHCSVRSQIVYTIYPFFPSFTRHHLFPTTHRSELWEISDTQNYSKAWFQTHFPIPSLQLRNQFPCRYVWQAKHPGVTPSKILSSQSNWLWRHWFFCSVSAAKRKYCHGLLFKEHCPLTSHISFVATCGCSNLKSILLHFSCLWFRFYSIALQIICSQHSFKPDVFVSRILKSPIPPETSIKK